MPAATASASHRFYSVAFVSAQVGWAAGDRGIVATTDGGVHWMLQLPESVRAVPLLDFIDGRTGFALEPISDVAGGGHSGGVDYLLYTTDGGAHWQARTNWTPVRFTDIAFATATAGWAIGYQDLDDHAGTLYRTDDGGESWSSVFSPAQSVCFGDVDVAWVAAYGDVMRSVDGGVTWATVFTNPVPGEDDKLWRPTLQCTGKEVAWLLLTDGVGLGHQGYFVFRTDDAGLHGLPVMQAPMRLSLNVHVGSGPYSGPISVVDANNTFVVGTCPACEEGDVSPFPSVIEATHDGGLTWDTPAEIVGAGQAAQSLSFVDAQHGWLASYNGVFATSNGGRTWMKQLP